MLWARAGALCATTVVAATMSLGCGDGSSAADANSDANASFPDASAPADAIPAPDVISYDAEPPVLGARCENPIEIAAGATHVGDTSVLPDFVTAPCSTGSSTGPDAIYLYDLGATPADLIVTTTVNETVMMPFDVVLHARTDCGKRNTTVGCVDAGWGERLELLAVMGQVYVMVDGTAQFGGEMSGAYTLTSSTRDIVTTGNACDPAGITSRCESGARCTSGTCVTDGPAAACSAATVVGGDLSAGVEYTGMTQSFQSDQYQGSCAAEPAGGYPENIYQITIAQTSDLVATTDFAETKLDTYLYLRSAMCDGTELGCHDDVDLPNHNLKSTLTMNGLTPGTYFLFVDGSSAYPGIGDYKLRITATPL